MTIFKYVRKSSIFIIAIVIAGFTSVSAAQASSLSTNWVMASIWEGESGQLAPHAPQQSRANTVTANGRLAVFWAEAGNLVPNDTNNVSDLFIFDRVTKVTQRINLGAGGAESNGHTRNATISADGRYIGFTTLATNTAAGPQCIPGHDCAFSGILDRTTGTITVASKDNNGQLMPVTYGMRPILTMHAAIISGDGGSFLFSATSQTPGDQTPDIFVRNLTTGEVKQANVNNLGQRSAGGVIDPSISSDGRLVAFSTGSALVPTDTNNAHDVYVRDIPANATMLVSHAHQSPQAANRASQAANISGNGQFVVFRSFATNLTAGSSTSVGHIFLYDRHTGSARQITAKYGAQPNAASYDPSITADGSHIVFMSNASNFVRTDTHALDIFLHYRSAGITRKIQLPPRTDVQQSLLGAPVINADGKAITYRLYAYSATNPERNAYGVYFNYDPVSHIPFYDPQDFLDLL